MNIMEECLMRINILKEQGLLTDLDVVNLLKNEETICVSEASIVMGVTVGLILPVTQKRMYITALEEMKKDHPGVTPYFAMSQNTSYGMMVSFLYVGSDSDSWEYERSDLKCKNPYAYVYNIDNEYGEVGSIRYDMFMGGPIRIQ